MFPKSAQKLGLRFLKKEWGNQHAILHNITLDSFIGGQILGLIVISNPKLQPQLEYLSPTGLGLYRVPLRSTSQFCIGGNYPCVKWMKDVVLKDKWIPKLLR